MLWEAPLSTESSWGLLEGIRFPVTAIIYWKCSTQFGQYEAASCFQSYYPFWLNILFMQKSGSMLKSPFLFFPLFWFICFLLLILGSINIGMLKRVSMQGNWQANYFDEIAYLVFTDVVGNSMLTRIKIHTTLWNFAEKNLIL